MAKRNNNGIKFLAFVASLGLLAVLFTTSCGKGGVKNTTSQNIEYQVVNLSPTFGPVSLYIDYTIYNNFSFYYPSPSGYFSLSSVDTPFQIRASPNQTTGTVVLAGNIFTRDDILAPNTKYTLFITGLATDSALKPVFLVDTALPPATGRGKVRFLNGSPLSPAFDIVANGYTDPGFTNIAYRNVSNYIEMPAGSYNFQVYQTGNNSAVLGTLQNVTVQDGRLYTLYSYGIIGHTTDTLAFGLGAIVNK